MSRIESISDMKQVYADIRGEIPEARSRRKLSTIYRQALSVITHSHTATWEKKYGDLLPKLRATAEKEFTKTIKLLNKRAKALGTEPDYDETYGGGNKRKAS